MNVIWVISDTLRRKDVGAYGNKKIHTPSIDAFANKAVRFDRHYMASFPTMPARADFLTGRWTMSFMQWEALPKGAVTLPQLLSTKGIHTAAVVDTPFYIRRGMNYDQGFHTFYEIPGQGSQMKGGNVRGEAFDIVKARRSESDCFAPQTFTKAMQWLEQHYREDFFLYIDAWDPHEPWDAPAYYTNLYWPGYDGELIGAPYQYWQNIPGYTEEKVNKAHATYCGEVTMVDTWFGYLMRKIENMGLLDNTAIIFTTDHGFYFGEHGLLGKLIFATDPQSGAIRGGIWTHSPFYEELSNIPLLIYVPGARPGTYGGLTSAVDLMPTAMDIMGQKIPPQVEGKSLLPQIQEHSSSSHRDYVVSAHPFFNEGYTMRAVDNMERVTEKASTTTVTTTEWSLLYSIYPGMSELYNLKSDPDQKKNVISNYPDMAKELHQILVKFMRETKVPASLLQPRLELRE